MADRASPIPRASEPIVPYLDSIPENQDALGAYLQPLFFGEDKWQRAMDYRRNALGQQPDIPAENDASITNVIANREFWVNEMFKAMAHLGESDGADSKHGKRFVVGRYDGREVEATCRAIFIALLDQVTNGYRGAYFEELAVSTGVEEVRKSNCQSRMMYVIAALKKDKLLCNEVMTDDTKIANLVYAPLGIIAQAFERHQRPNDSSVASVSSASTSVGGRTHSSLANLSATSVSNPSASSRARTRLLPVMHPLPVNQRSGINPLTRKRKSRKSDVSMSDVTSFTPEKTVSFEQPPEKADEDLDPMEEFERYEKKIQRMDSIEDGDSS